MNWTKTLIIIIIILSIILGLKIAGVDLIKDDKMSQTEILYLIKKGMIADNNYYSKNNKNVEVFKKDNIVLIKSNNIIYLWVNNETGENLLVDTENKKAYKLSKLITHNDDDSSRIFIEALSKLFENGLFSLQEEERKIIGDREVIVLGMGFNKNITKEEFVELRNAYEKMSNGAWIESANLADRDTVLQQNIVTEDEITEEEFIELKEKEASLFMIDKETGIIVNEEWIEFSTGTVTDEDVKKPDITGYEVIEE